MSKRTSKNWSNVIIIVLVLLNLVLVSLMVFKPRPPRPNPQRVIQHLKRNLDLSEEQSKQFLGLIEEHQKIMQGNRQELRKLRGDLPETANMTAEAKEKHLDQIADLERKQAAEISAHFSDLKGLLTPEQFEKFKQLHKNRPDRQPRGPN